MTELADFGFLNLAAQRLDWRPRIGLDEGLKRTIDWYEGHLSSASSP